MAATAQSTETQVAVISKSLEDCQAAQKECRINNTLQHTEFYQRLNLLEKNVAVLCAKFATWAAIGGVVGSIIGGVVVRKFTG